MRTKIGLQISLIIAVMFWSYNPATTTLSLKIEPTSVATAPKLSDARLAFISKQDTICDSEDGFCDTTIDLMNVDGSDRHHLISGRFTPLYMTSSPDGQYFIYVSPVNGQQNIFMVRVDTGEITQLTNNTNMQIESPSWSPDGEQIVFDGEPVQNGTLVRSGLSEIYTVNRDGTNQYRLTQNNADEFEPKWSPDGQQIAFISDRDGHDEIYVMKPDRSDQRSLTFNDIDNQLTDWPPDSHFLLFIRYITGKSTIYTLNTATGEQNNLTKNNANNYFPVWSPDGQKIAFVSDQTSDIEIYVMNPDGSSQYQLMNSPVSTYSPQWSPDSQSIAFISANDNELYIVSIDGTQPNCLTNGGAGSFIWVK